MVYTYTSTHYTSLQDSISSICKTILPFSFRKRRLLAIEHRLSKHQSDNLKWQQLSFHQILNLMGLCKEGIVTENQVSAFRTHLLETLIASPTEHEPPAVLRDKLIFLQELVYAECISDEEYHTSKRPLLQRLAVQGAEIDARDVILGGYHTSKADEWFVIDLKDEKPSANQQQTKQSSTVTKMKGVASVFSFIDPNKSTRSKEKDVQISGGNSICKKDRTVPKCCTENLVWSGDSDEKDSDSKTILMVESSPEARVVAKKHSLDEKEKKKYVTTTVSQGEQEGCGQGLVKGSVRFTKEAWGFDGLRRWKKNESEDETALSFADKKSLARASYSGKLVANPVAEGPDTKQIKRKLHPDGRATDFFVDKILGEKIRRELCRYPYVHLADDQVEVISTRLPIDKEDLIKLFPKTWCDQYGDIVLDVVRKGFKEHMRKMGHSRSKAVEKQHDTFDDENSHPNTVVPRDRSHCVKQANFSSMDNIRTHAINSSIDKGFKYNPFF